MKRIHVVSLFAAAALAMTGCVGTDVKPEAPATKAKPAEVVTVATKMAEPAPVPAAPVASANTSIVKATFKGELRRGEDFPIDQPVDIGWSRSGDLYVADRAGIQFFDKDGKYLRRIGYPEGATVPSGCTVDADGNYLLPFYSENIIRKIDEKGKTVWAATYPAQAPKANNPNYIFPDPDKSSYWITDGVRFQLIKAKRNGANFNIEKVLGRLGGSYSAQTKEADDLPGIAKAVLNPKDGMIYGLIAAEIKVIDPKTFKVVKTLGGAGMANDKFQGIGEVVFLQNGHMLVLDVMLNVIKEFDKDFNYICTYATSTGSRIKLEADFISGMAFREDIRRVYVTSGYLNKVFMFDLADAPAAK